MKITICGSQSEVESFISKFSLQEIALPPPAPVVPEPNIVKEIILQSNPIIVEEPVVNIVNGKTYNMSKDRGVSIFIDGIIYKKFVSASAASAYFGKSNLSENIKKGFKFSHNGIWFTIERTK